MSARSVRYREERDLYTDDLYKRVEISTKASHSVNCGDGLSKARAYGVAKELPAVADGGYWQKELADLALLALEGAEVGALMEEAIGMACGALGATFVSVMEASEDRAELLLRAGTGWADGEVGERSVSTGIDSPVERVSMAGYAMMSKDPVRTEDLRRDPRFGGCPLMREHGVVSGIMTRIDMSGRIDVNGRLYGVLGAHCTEPRSFGNEEGYWLRDVSRALGGALPHKASSDSQALQSTAHKLGHADFKILQRRLSLPDGLQPRHIEILMLLNEGFTQKEIARKLYCTDGTVRKHLKKIYRALEASGQVAAIARARQLGLFDY